MKTIDVTWPWSFFALRHVNCRSFLLILTYLLIKISNLRFRYQRVHHAIYKSVFWKGQPRFYIRVSLLQFVYHAPRFIISRKGRHCNFVIMLPCKLFMNEHSERWNRFYITISLQLFVFLWYKSLFLQTIIFTYVSAFRSINYNIPHIQKTHPYV